MSDPTAFRIEQGFPAAALASIVDLYWQAFRGKLGCVLRPDGRARALLARTLDPTHALSAIGYDGEVLGIAGFKTAEGTFFAVTMADLRAIYGRFGALWRGLLLEQLDRALVEGELVMDGIAVQETARGQGVGSALLAALAAEAVRRGAHGVRLEVVDTNPGAAALYVRAGFQAVGTSRTGLLRRVFGFRSATAMVWPVPTTTGEGRDAR